MTEIQNEENEIPKLPSVINNEKKIELEYFSKKYFLKIQLMENIDDIEINEKIIVITVEKDNSLEQFIFERIIKFDEFKNFGKIFVLHESIEEIYDFILLLMNDNNIFIKEIVQERSLILLLEKSFSGFKKPFSAEIELQKKERDDKEIIDILRRELKDKDKMLEEIKKKMNDKNIALEEKVRSLEEENKSLKEKILSIEKENICLKDNSKTLEEINQNENDKNKSLEEKIQNLEAKVRFLEVENESIKKKSKPIEEIDNSLNETIKTLEEIKQNMNEKNKSMEEKIQILGEKNKILEEENKIITDKIKYFENESKSIVNKINSLEIGKKYYLSKFSIKDFRVRITNGPYVSAVGIKSIGKFNGTKTFNAYKLDSIIGKRYPCNNGYIGCVFLFYVNGTTIRCSSRLYCSLSDERTPAIPTFNIISQNYDIYYIEIDLSGKQYDLFSFNNNSYYNNNLYYDNKFFNNIEKKFI